MASPSDFEESRQVNPLQRIRLLLHDYPTLGPAVVLLAMYAFFAVASPQQRFLSPLNMSLVIQQAMIVGTLLAAGIFGDGDAAYKVLTFAASALAALGYSVSRSKVKVAASLSAAPSDPSKA